MITKWFIQKIMVGLIFFRAGSFIFSILIAGFILLYKGLLWLQSDKWPSFPLIKFLPKEFFNSDFGQWLIYPNSWKGLNKIVAWFFTTSIEWALIVFAMCLSVGALLLESSLQSETEDKPENNR